MPDVIGELRELKDELRQAAEALRDSLRLQREIIDRREEIIKYIPISPLEIKKIHPYFTYPRDGTKKTVGAGVTQLDFWEGVVTLPDNTEEPISDKLEAYGDDEYIRSFQVDTNQDIKIWLDDFGKKPIDKDDIHLEAYQHFRRLYIETTEDTEFHVWASTFAEAYIRSLKPAIFRGSINENYQIVNPLSEYGDPVTEVGYYSGSDATYQILAKWDIPIGYYGVIHEISFTADSLALYRLTFGATQQFSDLQLTTPLALPLPANKLNGNQSIILEVRSAGGAIAVNGSITGKNVLTS
jgi:hypothetical protein